MAASLEGSNRPVSRCAGLEPVKGREGGKGGPDRKGRHPSPIEQMVHRCPCHEPRRTPAALLPDHKQEIVNSSPSDHLIAGFFGKSDRRSRRRGRFAGESARRQGVPAHGAER